MLVDGEPAWQVVVSWGEHGHVPFHEEVQWPDAGVVAIGGGAHVYFLALDTGELRRELPLPCRFGHLALAGDALYVLGYTDIVAIDAKLATRWWARGVAVDGIVFDEATPSIVRVAAEMDPPGGWFDVTLDATTGAELTRTPAFSDDYSGRFATRGLP